MSFSDNERFSTTDALLDAELILKDAGRAADENAEFALEEILAEYGAPSAAPRRETPPAVETAADAPADEAAQSVPEPWPPEPQPISLEELVAQTVASVQAEGTVLTEQKRTTRSLFSRRSQEETEQFYETYMPAREEAEEAENEPPEPEPHEAYQEYRALCKGQRKPLFAAAFVTAAAWTLAALAELGKLGAWWTGNALVRGGVFFGALLLVCVFGNDAIRCALRALGNRVCTFELAATLCAMVSLFDCAALAFLPERTANELFAPVSMLVMLFAMWGRYLTNRALCESFRVGAIGAPVYQVSSTAGGAAKRPGQHSGFYNAAERQDTASRWQAIILPLVLTATLVFALLAALECPTWADFLWCWSVILCAAATFAMPLAYGLPFYLLAKRLQKSGSAVAGCAGARDLVRTNCVVLTDSDLFPPGTVSLNGMKLYGEDVEKVACYAATMSHAAGTTGLDRVFDSLLESRGGRIEEVADLNYYEEGGVSGMIHGEEVLLGTLAFVRKMGVRLPGRLTLKTGVFLAVDKDLAAIFAIKYLAAENVSWALHALRRNRMTPVLATRDGNISPALLKRKFKTDALAIYPKISTRLVLSEQARGGRALALLYREGLMPYTEVMVGSKRMYSAVRKSTIATLFSSVAGTLISFYLVFAGAVYLLTPMQMALFLALFALVPVL
ncbi:MAG: hypothetical protein IJA73_01320, partial [Oscillospiraceae bacterium]|nr:hypothetical protein [Oscillospiraceae bacterium]